jgi:hypothetical protein
MFYSKETGGFYDPKIHGKDIPADAVEITDAEHDALLVGQSKGKRITARADGRPELADVIINLDELKQNKKKEIGRARDNAAEADVTVVAGNFKADDRSRRLLHEAIVLAVAGGSLPSTWADAAEREVEIASLNDLVVIAEAIAAQARATETSCRHLEKLIDRAADPAALNAVSWPGSEIK